VTDKPEAVVTQVASLFQRNAYALPTERPPAEVSVMMAAHTTAVVSIDGRSGSTIITFCKRIGVVVMSF
jgi:hypothetical protein